MSAKAAACISIAVFHLSGAFFSLGSAGLSAAEDFSFDMLREKARKLAAAPYVAPKLELADFWKNLTYDQHRDIRFKMESGLWVGKRGRFPSISSTRDGRRRRW